ncbi:MAG: cytochrome c maturation protein CcmE [Bacteroidota bacterium]
MKMKVVVGLAVVVVGIILGAVNFLESNVEYMDFTGAERTSKKAQVKGAWVREEAIAFDAERVKFTFSMKDDNNRVVRVVLDGAKPNNFELAESIVVKGRFVGEEFHATDVLTKCPSKYDGDADAVRKTL